MRSYYFLFALLLPGMGIAQSNNRNKEAEQIIITKKGTADDKMNIVVDGDKVTVNGKPAETDKEADISVQRRKIKDLDVYNDEESRPFDQGRSFNDFGGNQLQMMAPNKAMLGVVTQKTDAGVTVVNVTEESAADKAGLKEGDIITQVDGKEITAPDGLFSAIKDKNPGDQVSITYKRGHKTVTTNATLTKWKAPEGNTYLNQGGGNSFSMPPMDLNEIFRQLPNQGSNGNRNYRLYAYPGGESAGPKVGIRIQDLDKGDGVKILEVEKGSDADKAGLKSGDIIKEINGHTVNSTDNAGNVIRNNKRSSLEFKVDRNGNNRSITVTQSSRIKTADL